MSFRLYEFAVMRSWPLIGRRRGQRHNTPPFCEMWIGISAEENARRCKPSHEGWVTNRYPLRELGMTRVDCASWLFEHYQIVVPKSACVGCLIWNIGLWNTGARSGAVALAHHGSRTLKRLRC